MALVSIITPAYNAADVIGETIASIAAQCFNDIEHIVVDDASTDDTVEVVERWRGVVDGLRLVKADEHAETGAMRNMGFEHSTGDYILFVDSDDLLSPRYVNTCMHELYQHPRLGFVYTDEYYFSQQGDASWYNLRQMYEWSAVSMRYFDMVSVTALMRRETFIRAGGFRDMPVAEDWDFWLRVADCGIDGARIPEALFYHRIRGDRTRSRWGSRTREMTARADEIIREQHDVPGLEHALRNAYRCNKLYNAELAMAESLGSTTIPELRVADGRVLTRLTRGA